MDAADVRMKSKKAIQYCDVVSTWSKENGKKEWRYIFIPSMEVKDNSSFTNLASRFQIQE